MKVGDLFIALGFEVDDKNLQSFNTSVKNGAVGLGSIAAIAGTAIYALNRFVASSVESSVKLSNLTAITAAASDEVQRFYNVAGRTNPNVTLQETISLYEKLAETISNARMGKPSGEAAQLGIQNIGAMTESQVIDQLRANLDRNIKTWGLQGTVNLMKAVGIGPDFIQALQTSDAEFTKLANNPILSEESIGKMRDLAVSTKEFGFQWDITKAKLSTKIAPYYSQFLTNLSYDLGLVTEKAIGAVDALEKMQGPQATKADTNKKSLATAGAGAAIAGGLLIPGVNIVAGVAAIGIALNDLINYTRGKPSTTGDMLQDAGGLLKSGRNYISDELQKSPEQQQRERDQILKSGTPANWNFQPSITNNNNINVEASGDVGITGQAVADKVIERQNSRAQVDSLVKASGMHP